MNSGTYAYPLHIYWYWYTLRVCTKVVWYMTFFWIWSCMYIQYCDIFIRNLHSLLSLFFFTRFWNIINHNHLYLRTTFATRMKRILLHLILVNVLVQNVVYPFATSSILCQNHLYIYISLYLGTVTLFGDLSIWLVFIFMSFSLNSV